MICERCRNEISDEAVICPICGAQTGPVGQASPPSQPRYSPPQQPQHMPQYQSGHMAQPGYTPPIQPGYMAQPGYMPQQGYGYSPGPNPMYQPGGINVTVTNNASTSTNNTPVIVEVLLSVFLGIYGVGWLMAGETTIGTVLLICSLVLYWPIVIFTAFFTLGLGLLCLSPLAIAAIVFNGISLNNALKRKAAQVVMVQTR